MATSRFVCATALALALMAGASVCAQGASAQTTSQDAAIEVVAMIYAPGQSPVPDATTIGQLESSCPPVTTAVDPAQDGPGGVPEPETDANASQEWTLSSVLTNPSCLQTPIPISAISQVTVLESNGQPDLNSAAQLYPSDLTPQGDFPDQSVPVFWDARSQVIYERPARSATDDNAADMVSVGPGESLQFDVFEGETPVTVAVSATATSVSPRQAVTFTATAPGSPADESYAWDFDGAAADAEGSQTTVSFPQIGVYDVTVVANGQEVGFGSLQITVGSVPTGTGTETTATGPAKSSGKSPGAGAGKRRGTSSTKPKAKLKPKAKPKPEAKPKPKTATTPSLSTTAGIGVAKSTGSSAVSKASSGSATSSTSSVSSSATSANSTTGAGERNPAGGASDPGAATGKTRASRLPAASGPPATHSKPAGTRVRGRLLGTVLAVSSSSAAARTLSSGSAPALNRPGGGSVLWRAIAAALGVLALLGLGATRELRSIRSAR